MTRWLTIGFIGLYLGVLTLGNVCHMLHVGTGAHPLMYFVVWDMFCGWSAYDSRAYIVGEGESGKFYELAPGPWGDLYAWGNLGRQHYDALNNHTVRLGLNALRHTRHEPITRLFVIEESWAKKFNIPDSVWLARYGEPKEIQKYYRTRTVALPDGTITQSWSTWLAYQSQQMLADNPRIKAEANRSRSLFVIGPSRPGRDMLISPGTVADHASSPLTLVGSPMGN